MAPLFPFPEVWQSNEHPQPALYLLHSHLFFSLSNTGPPPPTAPTIQSAVAHTCRHPIGQPLYGKEARGRERKKEKKKTTNHNYVGRKSMFSRIMRGEGREGGDFFVALCIKKVFVWDFLFTLFWSYHWWVFKPQLLSLSCPFSICGYDRL